MNHRLNDLKEVFLAKVDDQKIENIENAVLSGEITPDEVEFAEHDLIEEYLENRLPPADRELFTKVFLTSRRRRRLLSETAALRSVARRAAANEVGGVSPISFTRLGIERFGDILRSRFALVGFAFLLIVVVGLGVVLLTRTDQRSSEIVALEKRYAEINQADLTDISRFDPDSVKTVFSSRLRSSNSASRIRLGDLPEFLFRFELPFDSGTPVSLTVERDGAPVFALKSLKTTAGELRAVLPRPVLAPGRLRFVVESDQDPSKKISYDVVIE